LVVALPAEAAAQRPGLIGYLLDSADRCAGRLAWIGDHPVCAGHALVADEVRRRPAYHHVGLLFGLSAERAHDIPAIRHAPNVPTRPL
jgi:hypothetical protein